MKNTAFSIFTFVLIAVTLVSCVSLQDREMTANEQAQAQVLGEVGVEFHSWQFMHIIGRKKIKEKAYQELLKQAQMQYVGDNIDVRNITITGKGSGWNALSYSAGTIIAIIFLPMGGGFPGYLSAWLPPFIGTTVVYGNIQKITAVGEVVSLPASAPSGSAAPVPSDPPGSAPAPGANF